MFDVPGTIAKLRAMRSWSEYRLAEESGVAQSTISSWYPPKNSLPTVSSLEKICDAFDMTLSQFFAVSAEPYALTAQQRSLLDNWSTLNQAQQKTLLEFIKTVHT